MKMNLMNCPACTFIYDTKVHSECPNCDGVVDLDETNENVEHQELFDSIQRNTHAVRAIGLFLMLSTVNMILMGFVFFVSSLNSSGTFLSAAFTAAGVGFVVGLVTLITVGRELGWSKLR
jgi:hypothetical protein